MKRLISIIAAVAILFAGCKKNVNPTIGNTVTVTNEKVTDIDPTSVVISGTYSYVSDLDGIYVIVSASGDMANALVFESVLNGKEFSATVTELKENTKYYYRYRYVSMGGYLESEAVKSFTTLKYGEPAVSTADVTEITGKSAKCGGEVTYDGGYAITARGICWSKSQNPTIGCEHTTDGSGTGSFTSSITGLTENTTYYVRAYATNEKGTGYGDAVGFRTTDPFNGYAYVDLDLPSGLLWAKFNVGADNPKGYGDYFAWGETTKKIYYNWITYQWCNGSYNTLTKYNTNSSYGTVDNKTVLELDDDPARAKWGGDWRMPTYDEMEELRNNCTWTWTTMGGVNGYRVASKSDNNKYIFLPAVGYYHESSLYGGGYYGYYWSSSLYTSNPLSAYYLNFNSSNVLMSNYYRYTGQLVRPVCQSQN